MLFEFGDKMQAKRAIKLVSKSNFMKKFKQNMELIKLDKQMES